MLKTPRDQRKCQIYNCLDDESHFFFNCGINKKDIRATFLKKKLTIILIIGKRHK
jgi:hypothetical protein